MSRLAELKSSLAKGSISTISEFDLRNKSKRTKTTGAYLKRLKKDTNKKSKLLFLTEQVFDFNPFTGEELPKGQSEFRPTTSSTSIILGIKEAVNENPELKEKYLQLAGVDSWDTSNIEEVTFADIKMLKRFRDDLIFTQDVMGIRDKVFTGQDFPIPYLVDYKVDELTGEILGEVPTIVQINRLQVDMYFQAVAKLMEEEEAKPEQDRLVEKDLKEEKRKLREKIITVSDRYPQNTAIALEIPLKANCSIDLEKFNPTTITKDDIMKHLVLVPVNKAIYTAMEKFEDGTNELVDKNAEFIEIDMKCSSDTEKKALGQNTTYGTAIAYIHDQEGFDNLNEKLIEFRESEEYAKIETLFLHSMKTKKFTKEVGSAFIKRLGSVMSISDENLTADVMTKHRGICQLIFGDEFSEALMDAEMGLVEGSKEVPEGLDKEVKEDITTSDDIANIIGGRKVDLDKLDEVTF